MFWCIGEGIFALLKFPWIFVIQAVPIVGGLGVVMLQNLSENIRLCYREAEDCARKAETAQNETLRADCLRSEQSWLALARSYEHHQRLTLFVNEHRGERKDHGEQVVDHVDTDGLATPTACVKPPLEPSKAERLENKLIAIVDDDEYARSGLSVLIESLGYRAATFASAEEFLASSMREDTACLILDVHMPGMNGPDLQAHLIAEGRCPPTVFITGQFDEHVRKRVIKAGAIGYLTKLGSADALVDSIEKAFAKTFVDEQNILWFSEQLKSEADPARRKLLGELLRDQESRFAATAERLEKIEKHVADCKAHIVRQRGLIDQLNLAGYDIGHAERLLQNLTELHDQFVSYQQALAGSVDRRACF